MKCCTILIDPLHSLQRLCHQTKVEPKSRKQKDLVTNVDKEVKQYSDLIKWPTENRSRIIFPEDSIPFELRSPYTNTEVTAYKYKVFNFNNYIIFLV